MTIRLMTKTHTHTYAEKKTLGNTVENAGTKLWKENSIDSGLFGLFCKAGVWKVEQTFIGCIALYSTI